MNLKEKAELLYKQGEQQTDWFINLFEVFGQNKYLYLEKKVRENRRKIMESEDYFANRCKQKTIFESLL